MSAWRRSGAAVRLLAVLCLTAGCAATQQQQPSACTANTNTLADDLLDVVAQVIRAELPPLVSKIQSRIDALQDRLDNIPRPRDCSDLPAGYPTGVYVLWPDSGLTLLPVQGFCDMDTDGGRWTVFQRRANITPRQDFYLGWDSYIKGFGSPKEEFWWGLQYLSKLTLAKGRRYELRVELEDFDGNKKYAIYQGFRVLSEEDGYRLRVSNYTGDAGDGLRFDDKIRFSTRDRDHDPRGSVDCAKDLKGGWWYGWSCGGSNLNGLYLEPGTVNLTGIWWYTWKESWESLKSTEMKFRPT